MILDILYCYEENSGEYECRAVNKVGQDLTKATLRCVSKANLILDSQLPRVRLLFIYFWDGVGNKGNLTTLNKRKLVV